MKLAKASLIKKLVPQGSRVALDILIVCDACLVEGIQSRTGLSKDLKQHCHLEHYSVSFHYTSCKAGAPTAMLTSQKPVHFAHAYRTAYYANTSE